jgi:Zn-dependent M16 (insulinase) family peptidase
MLSVHSSFKLLATTTIDSGETLYLLQHIERGCRVLFIHHLDPKVESQERSFSISFRTLPKNSHGTPHILEHLILAGTDHYPGVDPFFGIGRRGLSTFLNAFTGQKYTSYPASSCSEQDLYNIFQVYFHCIFSPSLSKEALAQEGFRYEYTDINDPNTPLRPSGVVYNEMQGVWSHSDERSYAYLTQELFPDLPFCNSSGGIPSEVMNITHQEIVEFYNSHYHPSQALFFFYGALEIQEQLQQLDQLLSQLPNTPEPQAVLSPPPSLPSQPYTWIERNYPVPSHETDPLHYLTIGTVGPLASDFLPAIALEILALYLAGHDTSPLKEAILDLEQCDEFELDIDNENDHLLLIARFSNINREAAQQLADQYSTTLQELMEQPIPQEQLLAAAHQYRFASAERNHDGYPYGIKLLLRLMPSLLEASASIQELAQLVEIHGLIDQVVEKLLHTDLFYQLIDEFLLHPKRKTSLLLLPSSQQGNQEQQMIQAKTAAQPNTPEITASRIQIATSLRNKENLSQGYNALPLLQRDQIPSQETDFKLIQKTISGINCFLHETQTQKIGYLTFAIELDLPHALRMLSWIRLLTDLLGEVDTSVEYPTLLEQIERYTGGIECNISIETPLHQPHNPKIFLCLEGKAFERDVPKLLALLDDICFHSHFKNEKRLYQLIQQCKTQEIEEYKQHPLHYATLQSGSQLSLSGFIENQLFGTPYYRWIVDLANNWKEESTFNLPYLEQALNILRHSLSHLIVTGEPSLLESIEKLDLLPSSLPPIYKNLRRPNSPPLLELNLPESLISLEGHDATGAASSRLTLPFEEKLLYYPHLKILSHFWEEHLLHPKIREQGGAYGSGINLSFSTSDIAFYSYRDPTPLHSLDIFMDTWDTLETQQIPREAQLYESILGVIRQRDRPISPGNRGWVAFSYHQRGISWEMRQQIRQQILAITEQELELAAEKLSQLPLEWNHVYVPANP